MDRSLWFLAWLRAVALLRRGARALGRPKGVLLAVAYALMLGPGLAGAAAFYVAFSQPDRPSLPAWAVDRFGPVLLLGATVLSLAGSTGNWTLHFAPAEVDFLLAGPYRRRQLIAFRLILGTIGAAAMAAYVAPAGLAFAPRLASSFFGAFLLLLFFQLTQTAVGLGRGLVGAFAWRQGRREALLVLLAAAILVALAALHGRDRPEDHDWATLAHSVEDAPATRAALMPFRWFVRVGTARDPGELARAAAPAALVDLGLVALIFALDAGYLEAATAASARRHAARPPAARTRPRARPRVADPPWWGGVGPNAWRQLLAARGDAVLGLAMLAGAVGYGLGLLLAAAATGAAAATAALGPILPMFVGVGVPVLAVSLNSLLPYDFRGDLDAMDVLKTLPIAPWRLALGQILAPAALASLIQGAGGLGFLVGLGGPAGWSWGLAAVGLLVLLLPANLFFAGVVNLLFLWFPVRLVRGQVAPAALAREALVTLAKGLAAILAVAAAGVGGLAAALATGSPAAAPVGAGLALALLAAAPVVPLGRAFDAFDVGSDTPA